ncbi:MAG: hypothetical protein ABSG62_14450, partial [Terracidiphilus sp.]
VNEDRGRVAFQRGPIVFCMEQLDQPARERFANLVGYTAKLDAATTAHFEPDLLGGVLVLEHPGSIVQGPRETGLYYSAAESEALTESPTTLRLIPYYAWANRTLSAMQVWIPYRFG